SVSSVAKIEFRANRPPAPSKSSSSACARSEPALICGSSFHLRRPAVLFFPSARRTECRFATSAESHPQLASPAPERPHEGDRGAAHEGADQVAEEDGLVGLLLEHLQRWTPDL